MRYSKEGDNFIMKITFYTHTINFLQSTNAQTNDFMET